eukprot:scaffold42802_cov31-Tisochrysis_lutea.AAC.5
MRSAKKRKGTDQREARRERRRVMEWRDCPPPASRGRRGDWLGRGLARGRSGHGHGVGVWANGEG